MVPESVITFFIAWVMSYNLLAQAGAVDVRVYFGGGYTFVPKHRLYDAQISTTLEQMGGK